MSSKDSEKSVTEAAKDGHLDCVKTLMEKGANVNTTDESGRTALMRAAKNGHLDIAEHLLTAGAEVNLANMIGYTALMDAAWKGHVKCVAISVKLTYSPE